MLKSKSYAIMNEFLWSYSSFIHLHFGWTKRKKNIYHVNCVPVNEHCNMRECVKCDSFIVLTIKMRREEEEDGKKWESFHNSGVPVVSVGDTFHFTAFSFNLYDNKKWKRNFHSEIKILFIPNAPPSGTTQAEKWEDAFPFKITDKFIFN